MWIFSPKEGKKRRRENGYFLKIADSVQYTILSKKQSNEEENRSNYDNIHEKLLRPCREVHQTRRRAPGPQSVRQKPLPKHYFAYSIEYNQGWIGQIVVGAPAVEKFKTTI